MKLSIDKKFILLIVSFFLLLGIVFISNYYISKSSLINETMAHNKNSIKLVFHNIKDHLLSSNRENIQSLLQLAIESTNLSYIKIQYKDYLFTKENLIKNSNYSQNIDWEINDVITDITNGYVKKIDTTLYKLQAPKKANIKESISFKFFLYKNSTLLNSIASLSFYYEASRKNLNLDQLQSILKKQTLQLFDDSLVDFEYTIDNTAIEEKINSLYHKHLLYYFLFIFFLSLVFAFIYFIFIKKMLLDSIQAFYTTMEEALDNKLTYRVEQNIGNEFVDGAFGLLSKILKKYMIVLNELNINKNILERKVFTDDLTGLPNQKVFELDLKNMFIATSDGFVGTIRLESLGFFTNKFGSALANHLIEEFTSVVQNKFYELDLEEATLYRFFGSEFAMILKNDTEDKILEFSQSLAEELIEMGVRYEIDSTPAYFGLIPFDKYGTIDAILHSLSDTYTKAKQSDDSYHIVSPSEVLDKFSIIEQNVREIIENNSFEIEYGFETKNIDTAKIMMLEAVPILYDKNKEKFSIGVFVSAAEKIDLAVTFDKKVIESVVNHINTHSFTYSIVINLSMFSLKDTQFLTWLHSIFLHNQNISKQIVFSMTSYNASTDIEVFKSFIDEIHRFGAKIILKRYTTNDFTIEQLDELDLDYLRIDKSYTTNMSNDRDKKHFLRTIVNLGQSNEILIIGDNIKDEKDVQTCANIGLDAISNY